nr:uncharacterized protein LOC111413165 [Onthophagus taurus]
MGKVCKGTRANWNAEMMTEALELIRKSHSPRYVEKPCGIPRTTLRNHIKTGDAKRKLGQRPLLNEEQEADLESIIIRMSRVGLPLTPRTVRRSVFRFCQEANIGHKFNNEKELAGFTWYKSFLKRHPNIAKRKPQMMNITRAQKLNPTIVQDHFSKLDTVLRELNLKHSPQFIYNLDEKGCRLTLHHAHKVLAEKGERRIHLLANEHAENVTLVACVNALGQAVPPMIIFKGLRKKDTYSDNLPPGSTVQMSAKGSMTRELFIVWLQHFAKFKPAGRVLVVIDGASCRLDISIVEEAEKLDVSLYCLPSNTTHELQPLDKAVFRSFEQYCDTELLNYWEATNVPCQTLKKDRFGIVFNKVWQQCMSISNIQNGFPATGIYPFDPSVIPENAFSPSLLTYKQQETEALIHFSGCFSWTNANKETDSTTPKIKILSFITVKQPNRYNASVPKKSPKKKSFAKQMKNPRRKAINYNAQLLKTGLFRKGTNPPI